jgi:glycine C-acetyltransferase
VAAILDKQDVIVSDRLNHASIIDGARLSRVEIKVFEHKDAEHADALLEETKAADRRQLLITDGVFSMDGDIAPLPALVEVAERHGAIMMVDDAHASGVLGKGGAGTVDHFGLHGRVDVQVGTLSKAIGVVGGFIAGPHELIDERTARRSRGLHRGPRHHRGRAGADRPALVEHTDVQGGPA